MTDTGQVPAEGLPENAGQVEQPDVSAPGAFTYLSESTIEDEDLLLPGAQSAWGNEVAPPAPEPVVETVHEPGPHETGGRDSGSVDLSAVRHPGPSVTPPPVAPRRPLHLGPPIPDASASPVRSLADRGPAGAPVRHPGPPPAGPEYLDAPQREMSPQGAAPWGTPAPAAGPAAPAPGRPAEQPGAAQAVMARLAAETTTAQPASTEETAPETQPVSVPEPQTEAAAQAEPEVQAEGAVQPEAAEESPAAAAPEAALEPEAGAEPQPVGGPAEEPAAPEATPSESPAPVADVPVTDPATPEAGAIGGDQPAAPAPAAAPPVGGPPEVPAPEASAPEQQPQPEALQPEALPEPAPETAAGLEAVPEAVTVAPEAEPSIPVATPVDAAPVPPAPSDTEPSTAPEPPITPEADTAPETSTAQEAPSAPDTPSAPPAPEAAEPAPQEPAPPAPEVTAATPVTEPAPVAQDFPAPPVLPVAEAAVPEAPQPTEAFEPPDTTFGAPAAPEPIPAPEPTAPAEAVAPEPQPAEAAASAEAPSAVAETPLPAAAPEPALRPTPLAAAAPTEPDVPQPQHAPDTAPLTEPTVPAPEQTAAEQTAPEPAEPQQTAPEPAEAQHPAPQQPQPALPEPLAAAPTPETAPEPEPAPAAPEAPAAPLLTEPAQAPAQEAPVPEAPAHLTTPDAADTLLPANPPQILTEHPQGPAHLPEQENVALVPVGSPAPVAFPDAASAQAGPPADPGAPQPQPPVGPAAETGIPAPRAAAPDQEAVPVPDPEVAQTPDDLDTRAADQADAAVTAVREPVGPAAPAYDDAERAAVLKVMRERRDIRNGFRADPIPHEVLLRVLEAAHTAPSVGHSQPWDFVVIRSADTRRAMHELATRQRDAYAKSLPKGRAKQFKELKIEAILDTPVNIVVTADPTRGGRHTLGRHTQPQMAPYSSALAVENLWLAARAEGLGVGWVSFFDEREMVRALGLPEHLEVVAYLCVGYVDEFPDEPELMQAGWAKRRPLSWVVHEETYGRRALPGEDPHDLLAETVAGIRPLDAKALGEAWERQKRMTKPAGALGMLEIISAQLSGLSRQCPPPIPEPAAVAIFAGDHGVHAQGVTPWPQEVTAQMVANFLGGGAVCNAFAAQVGAEVCVVDVGVVADLPATPGLLPRKIRAGTSDMTTGPAMTREEAKQAVEVGIETARDLVAAGNKALLTGEMGIANTTASAALISVFTGADPAEVTGRGTGINDETLARKTDVVRRALELHQPDPADPIGVLAAIGGFEHAAMVGLLLGGASLRTPVILDGVSAGAAALVARAIAPEVLAACIAGHRSAEPGHVAALNKLGLRPLVDLDLRLGEGTGALLALPLVQSTARAMHEVATFDSAGVTEK
ncbi:MULTISPECIES: nicotinate-nucleotide--dimethylbenzimidazole phosphoribosyltransferase [unclassified Streptomyces]|uniref:nicotinate-nucleotide--dimethylbenzimidazole phosphoribosyltransferase n=1 Tax=unclassified Streptomyces TaxID=2593676 RepID=UPI0037F4C476